MRRTAGEVRAGDRFGPYELIRQLAVGGMAEIYLAKATGISGFEKYVALKVIHPNYSQDEHFIEMLVEEAKIVVHLTQPNIVQIFDLGRIGDVRYIAMEYVDGPDLYHIMRTITSVGEQVGFDVAAFIALEICAAMDYAHRCTDQAGQALRIIHRDISPQNIIVSRAGEVKLADFGIAKATVRARQTAVGVIKGKYYYMSPEQAWGDPIDHRTDLFSAGVVLYEVIVGQMLYLEEDLGSLLDKVRKAEIAPPSHLRSDVPPELERIVMKAVSRRPEDRFQSAYDFQTALTHFLFSYAPSFTVGRIRTLVDRAVTIEERRHTDEGDGTGSAVGTAKLGQDSLMDQREFRPLTTHSLLSLEIDENESIQPVHDLPSYDSYDDDETLISDPPMMDPLSGPAPMLPVLASVSGAPRLTDRPGAPPAVISDPGGPGVQITNEWDEIEGPTTVLSGRRDGQTGPDRPVQSALPQLPANGHPPGRVEPDAVEPDAVEPDAVESDAVEQMLQRPRGQRHMILVGVLICVVIIGVAMFIITARTISSKPGSVRVVTDPPGAKVYYRGKYVGKTPHRLDSLTLDEVHWVRLESERCESRAVKLNVEAGKTKTLRVTLQNCDKQR